MYRASDYEIADGGVLLRGHLLKGADPKTFQHLYGCWSRDARSVFWSFERRTKIDAGSFEALNDIWGRDRDAAYPASGKPIAGADAASFRSLDAGVIGAGITLLHGAMAGYAADASKVWFHLLTYPSAWQVKAADAATFVSLGYKYGRDETAVYFEQRRVHGAVPRSFRFIGFIGEGGYSLDEASVFYNEHRIDGADPRTFRVLPLGSGIAAVDHTGYYVSGQRVPRDVYEGLGSSELDRLRQHLADVSSGALGGEIAKASDWTY